MRGAPPARPQGVWVRQPFRDRGIRAPCGAPRARAPAPAHVVQKEALARGAGGGGDFFSMLNIRMSRTPIAGGFPVQYLLPRARWSCLGLKIDFTLGQIVLTMFSGQINIYYHPWVKPKAQKQIVLLFKFSFLQ
jgi:hypothetical protein